MHSTFNLYLKSVYTVFIVCVWIITWLPVVFIVSVLNVTWLLLSYEQSLEYLFLKSNQFMFTLCLLSVYELSIDCLYLKQSVHVYTVFIVSIWTINWLFVFETVSSCLHCVYCQYMNYQLIVCTWNSQFTFTLCLLFQRGNLTYLLCGDKGLVQCMENIFLYGFRSARIFRNKFYTWDYLG